MFRRLPGLHRTGLTMYPGGLARKILQPRFPGGETLSVPSLGQWSPRSNYDPGMWSPVSNVAVLGLPPVNWGGFL